MILLACAALMAAEPGPDGLAEASHALNAGRLEQARVLIGEAVSRGASGARLERLLADLALARGHHDEALARYQQLLRTGPMETELLELAAVAAWRSGKSEVAGQFTRQATARNDASWRAWNLAGVMADEAKDWKLADSAYSSGLAISPGRPEILNNLGWSHILRGEWRKALGYFDKAYKKAPLLPRLRNNRDLVQAALADRLPTRRPGESAADWTARLNDAGVAARLRGDMKRAEAAFSTAVEARPEWYERAGNNLRDLAGTAAD